jgi:hypothetical protein
MPRQAVAHAREALFCCSSGRNAGTCFGGQTKQLTQYTATCFHSSKISDHIITYTKSWDHLQYKTHHKTGQRWSGLHVC